MKNLWGQGFEAFSPGSRLLSGAWDSPLRDCRLWFRFQLWIRLWVDLTLWVLRETKDNNGSFTLCPPSAPVSNVKLLVLSEPRASPGDPNGPTDLVGITTLAARVLLRLFQDTVEHIQYQSDGFLGGPRP